MDVPYMNSWSKGPFSPQLGCVEAKYNIGVSSPNSFQVSEVFYVQYRFNFYISHSNPLILEVFSNASCHAMLNDHPRGSTAIRRIGSFQLTMSSNKILLPERIITYMVRVGEAFIRSSQTTV